MAKKRKTPAQPGQDWNAPAAALLAELPTDRDELLAGLEPPGFVLVDVVLPSYRAFIARRWAAEAAARIKATKAGGLNAKGKGAGPERDPASPGMTMEARPTWWSSSPASGAKS